MSIGHEIKKDFEGTSFDYGNAEETIGFIADNYYEAMEIHRSLNKQLNEIEKIKQKAHNDLRVLRDEEAKWERTGKVPNGFDKEEHERRKEYLSQLREVKIEVVADDKLTYLIKHHRWIFKILEAGDLNVRKPLSYVASRSVSICLWFQRRMMKATAKHTDSLAIDKFLKSRLKEMDKLPDMIKRYILEV